MDSDPSQIVMNGAKDFSKLVTQVIRVNSFTSIVYGKGRTINYSIERIARKLRPYILENKTLLFMED